MIHPEVKQTLTRVQIVYSEFPIQHLLQSQSSEPCSAPAQPEAISGSQLESPGQNIGNSQSADKENAPPTATPPVGAQSNNLPPQILSMLNSIIHTLRTYFSQYPPHTIQRLGELILSPKEHYRNLPSYIHAVDRVVHVTSPANVYPLPAAIPDAFSTRPLINGVGPSADLGTLSWGSSTQAQSSLGSDESLGGALLTPIPWLVNRSAAGNSNGNTRIKDLEGEIKTENTETIDGPNGAGSIETVSVSVNGISSASLTTTLSDESISGLRAECGAPQGELLLQEQQTSIEPASQHLGTSISGEAKGDEGDDEVPHARGPDEIGVEDTGPQVAGSMGMHMQAIDVEAAVGRRAEGHDRVAENEEALITPKREAAEEIERGGKRIRDSTVPSKGEQDFKAKSESEFGAPLDVDGKSEGEARIGGGKDEFVNTMDTTALK